MCVLSLRSLLACAEFVNGIPSAGTMILLSKIAETEQNGERDRNGEWGTQSLNSVRLIFYRTHVAQDLIWFYHN